MMISHLQSGPPLEHNMPSRLSPRAVHWLVGVGRSCWITSVLSGILLSLTGCTQFNLKEKIPWNDTSGRAKVPTRVTALWTHTVLEQPGRPGVRGFGGRLMFHDREQDKPVRVEGGLTVYAFDDTEEHQTQPERKFVFTSEQLEKHYSQSRLGHTYSIWLPWDEVGGAPRRISLVVRFEPVGSGMIVSETAHVNLPGIDPKVREEMLASKTARLKKSAAKLKGKAASEPSADAISEEAGGSGVRQASHTVHELSATNADEAGPKDQAPTNPDSFTIDIPPRVAANLGRGHETPLMSDELEEPAEAESDSKPSGETKGRASSTEESEPLRPARYVRHRHQARKLGESLRDRDRAGLKLAPSSAPSPLSKPQKPAQTAAGPASTTAPEAGGQ